MIAGSIRQVEPVSGGRPLLVPLDTDEEIRPIISPVTNTDKLTTKTPKGSVSVQESLQIVLEPYPMEVENSSTEEQFQAIYRLGKGILDNDEVKKLAAIDLIPEKALRIVLTSDLLFATGDSALSERAKIDLRKVTGFLQGTQYQINIIGHTDNMPMTSKKYASNWELSVTRATQVARFLIDEIGMNPRQLIVSGHSSFHPIAPNTTAENRSKNRRVEIIVSKKSSDPLPMNS